MQLLQQQQTWQVQLLNKIWMTRQIWNNNNANGNIIVIVLSESVVYMGIFKYACSAKWQYLHDIRRALEPGLRFTKGETQKCL